MAWQFTLNDYTSGTLNATIIPEPVGWDAVTLHLKRDETSHGFFGFEDDTFSSLQYDGTGAAILRNAYYNYGIQANVQLGVTYQCRTEAPDNLYLGTFDFTTFKDYTADRCYVECATIVSDSYYLFKNRHSQQVDLDSLASFDQQPVAQTINCLATFDSATQQIRVNQLLNGLPPGSKITIAGSNLNSGIFTVASSKPDYTSVNPDLAIAGESGSIVASAIFEPENSSISINQLITIPVGATITTTNATFPATSPHYYDNSGQYTVIATQQFFNYTRLTVSVITMANTDPSCINGTAGTNSMTGTNEDTVLIASTSITYTSQPTSTLIQVAETVYDETTGYQVYGSISGNTLTLATVPLVTWPLLANGTVLTGGAGVQAGNTITAGTGLNMYSLSQSQPAACGPVWLSTGVTLTGAWLTNNMQPYAALSKVITVPSKTITATSIWKAATDVKYHSNDVQSPTYPGGTYPHILGLPTNGFILVPDWPNIQSDVTETDVGTGIPNFSPDLNHPPEQLIYFRQSALGCSGTATIEFNITGKFTAADNSAYNSGWGVSDWLSSGTFNQFTLFVQTGQAWAQSFPTPLFTGSIIKATIAVTANGSFSYKGTAGFAFNPGDYLWVYFGLWPIYARGNDVYMYINAGSYCKFTLSSQCTDTPCAVYLVNEALSRCTESYTNGQIQVYSDYFGRTNAQPVPGLANGCGALACITNGLRLRGCTMPDGSSIPKFFTSLDDMFTALDAIHNIGMGLEADPTIGRAGMLRLRIEPFEWFFNDAPILGTPFTGVMNYSRETVTGLLCSTFKCGYQQFKTWNNNGLYDIFGSRTYRTPLNHLTNQVDKTCKWMASDYAIEFTRRQFGLTTSDSRYDDNTFMLCLTPQFTGAVEQVQRCFLIATTGAIFNTGSTITVTNATFAGNNGTFTNITNVPSAIPGLSYIFVTGQPFVNEFAAGITVVNGSTTYASVPCYFIGSNGAIALPQINLFGAAPADSLTLGGIYGGTYTIQTMYAPVSSGQPDNISAADFPMVIFPTSALSYYGPYIYNPATTITDNTTPLYVVEQGMVNGTNILSPDTVMNYRISPARNTMRHYRNVITDRQYATENLIFTGGQGNFYALGKLADSCTPENDNISEGGNLSLSNFTTPADAEPLFYPEIVKFEYPLSWADFLTIQINPYGTIQYQHGTEDVQTGYLVDLQYHPYTGMAQFTLYPKIG